MHRGRLATSQPGLARLPRPIEDVSHGHACIYIFMCDCVCVCACHTAPLPGVRSPLYIFSPALSPAHTLALSLTHTLARCRSLESRLSIWRTQARTARRTSTTTSLTGASLPPPPPSLSPLPFLSFSLCFFPTLLSLSLCLAFAGCFGSCHYYRIICAANLPEFEGETCFPG
jgi:hypothetical protein